VVTAHAGGASTAYFRDSFLPSRWASRLGECRDLVCENNRVWVRSTAGLELVDFVIYGASTTISVTQRVPLDSMLGGCAG